MSEISEDALEARVFQLDEICKWLEVNGWSTAAAELFERRDLFLLAPPPRRDEHWVEETRTCARCEALLIVQRHVRAVTCKDCLAAERQGTDQGKGNGP